MSSRLRSRLRASTSLSGGGGGPAAALDLNFITGSYQTSGGSYAFQDLIRFSRTTAGTFVGSNGLIQNSPISNNLLLWTEEADNAAWTKTAVAVQSNLLLRSQEYDNASWVKNTSFIQTNLLTYSEEFDNAAWTKSNVTITANTTVAPDGLTTGDTITGVTAGASNSIRPATLPTAAATQYTFSIWVRAGTATTCSLVIRDNTAAINLAVTSQIVSGPGSVSGSPIANVTGLSATEWTRVAITLAAPATAGNLLIAYFYPETATSAATTAQSNIIWGAQLVQGTAPGNYQRTEAAALAVAYTAPDGTLTADKLVIDSAAPFSSSYIRQNISKAANTTTYTTSVYAKAGELNQVRVVVRDSATSANGAGVAISLVDGSIVTAPYVVGTFTGPSAVVTNVGSGWYRIALTFTTGTETAIWAQTVFPQDSVVTTGDGASGIYVWGSQLVNGPAAEAYQPTAASVVAIQHLAPNGVLSANKIVENSANTFHFVREAVTAANAAHTFTTYLKAGERTRAIVSMSDISTGDASIGVDLTNGTTFTPTSLSVGSWTAISSSVTSVGNGWYRVRVTGTKGAGTQIAGSVFPTNGTSATFLGDGSSGFYMWGSQLEVGSSATAYSRNADGRYAPRFDYDPVTLEAKGLLIEEQRTNLLTYSEQFDNAAWLPGAVTTVTVTANAATSPDGTADADKLIIANGVSAGTTTYLYTNISKSAVATTYTFSCYAKEAEYDLFRILINDNAASANFALGAWSLVDGSVNEVPSVGGTFTNPSGTATAVGNGWYRITMTFTSSTETTLRVRIYPRDSSGVVTGDGVSGIYIFGAQLEAGASATAYIPTAASTVTRNIENALTLGPAFSSFYNQTQGTFVVELDMSATTGRWIVSASDGTANNVVGMNTSSGGGPRASIGFGGINQVGVGVAFVATPNQLLKVGLAYSAASSIFACNGTLSPEDTSAMIPTVSQLQLFANGTAAAVGNGHIRRVRYYNTRLTDAQLQALTT